MSDSQPPDPAPKATKSDRPPSRPPGSGRDSSAHLHAALSASGRAEASLSTLMRAIRDLSSGVSSAREANVQLLRELEAMSDLLGAANERQLALKNRVGLLEQSLERAHVEAQRERAYILDQQDAFIAAMMDDHEQVIAELNREIDAARQRPSARAGSFPNLPAQVEPSEPSDDALRSELEEAKRTIEKLLGERDRARETLLKVQAQRDEAQAALVDIGRDPSRASQGRMAAVIPTVGSTPSLRNAPTLPPPETARPISSPQAAPAPTASSTAPTIPPPMIGQSAAGGRELDHGVFPPEELRGAVHAPPSSGGGARAAAPKRSLTPPGPPSDIPPPNNTSNRPGGYSLTNSVAPEHVSGTPRVSRAPRG
ncbi:MAG TPA: hypothetical protein VMI54_28415 [Polyangiaceae bacterium]|nr:hypothetical protein [Polyangiaceae bacterium]